MLPPSTLHILSFGDSLTAGYSNPNLPYHPYTTSLQTSLSLTFPSTNITIDNRGLPGDQVTSPPGTFLPRITTIYEELPVSTPYNFALILGGTNDLGQSRLAEDIFTALQQTWNIPLTHGTKVLALTIPDCAGCGVDAAVQLEAVNKLILGYRAPKAGTFYTFDLNNALPYRDTSYGKRDEIWANEIHFTPRGYDLIGELLAERLVGLIREGEPQMSGASKLELLRMRSLMTKRKDHQKFKESS